MKSFFKRLVKVAEWLCFIWRHDDWDYYFFYQLTAFKLRRIDKTLRAGWAKHEKAVLQSLRIAIKLADNLASKDYEDRATNIIYAKWGEPVLSIKPTEKSLDIKYPKVHTEDDKEQHLKDRLTMYEVGANIRARDKRNLFRILEKYVESYWD